MFLKSIFTNSFGILISRIFGFIRDLLTASILGANIYSDMFFVAFKLPNLFRRIFAEGAFTQSFLPTFVKTKQKAYFAVSIFIRFFILLLIFSILVTIFDTFFTKIIAFGFSKEIIKEAAPLVAINFYYLLLIFCVTFLATLLQYKNHFATTAFSTALLNISMISALLFSKGLPPKVIVYYMSYAVIVGGILQLLVHVVAIKKMHLEKIFIYGFACIKKGKGDKKDLSGFYNLFIPSIIGNSTAQLSAFLDTFLATFLASGAISYLYYANRVFQLPLALFAIATSVAIFPKITRNIKQGDEEKAKIILKKSFWLLSYLLIFSTVGAVMLSKEIIWLLFQRGAFNAVDTANSSFVLSMYMIGLLPFGLSKIFSLWLYARHEQKTAAKISSISLGVNIILSLLLIVPLKAAGLALASSISGFILFYLTLRKFGFCSFLDIIRDKKAIYLVFSVILEIVVLLLFKGFIDVYI